MTDEDRMFISMQLPVSLCKEAEERAEAEDRTRSSLIRVALRYYLRETTP